MLSRFFVRLAVLSAAIWFCICTLAFGQQTSPKKLEWRQFPVPQGTPERERPPDSEFLKVLPVLNPRPKPDKTAEDRGFIVWWPDYSVQLFSEQPP